LEAFVQITSGNSSAKNIWVWYRKNGVNITNSARIVTSDINNGYITAFLVRDISLVASDYIELMYASSDTSISIASVGATAFAPAAPAVSISITQIQQ